MIGDIVESVLLLLVMGIFINVWWKARVPGSIFIHEKNRVAGNKMKVAVMLLWCILISRALIQPERYTWIWS